MVNKSVFLFFVLVLCAFVFAYVSPIFDPGHGADEVFVFINGAESTLQDAIDNGEFDVDYTGGAYSGVIDAGHNAGDIFVSVNGVDKDFQEAINDGSLCSFVGGVGSYSGSGYMGQRGEEILISIGVYEKNLQEAINDGDFYECVRVDCVGSWNLNYGSCSATACGTSGNYDSLYTVSVSAEYGGAACAVADGTFVDDGGNACSAAACAPATASTCGGFASGYFCFRGSFIGRTRPNSLSGCKAWCETLSNVGCCQYSSNNGYCKAVTGTPRDAGAGGSQYSANCA
mgnify:CR=1 FL=1